ILQCFSFPIPRWLGYHTSQALTISLGRPPQARPFCLVPPGPATDSDAGHSAVDVNGLPGDVSRFIRTEIDRRRRDFVGRTQARRRNLGKDRFALLVVQRVSHRRRNEPWCDAVGGYVA